MFHELTHARCYLIKDIPSGERATDIYSIARLPIEYIKQKKDKDGYDRIRLSLRDNNYPNIFKKWGIIQNKTYNFIIPQIEKIDNWKHFIRGWFDGDGCIYINKNNYPRINFC